MAHAAARPTRGEAWSTEVPLGRCAVRHESKAASMHVYTQPQKRGITMTDDRIVQRLEEQLRDAHATNADLRERLNDIESGSRQPERRWPKP